MPTIADNRRWSQYDWRNQGDEWSAPWGTTAHLWHGTILPRILAAVPRAHPGDRARPRALHPAPAVVLPAPVRRRPRRAEHPAERPADGIDHGRDIETPAHVSRIELDTDTFVPAAMSLGAGDRTLGTFVVSKRLR